LPADSGERRSGLLAGSPRIAQVSRRWLVLDRPSIQRRFARGEL